MKKRGEIRREPSQERSRERVAQILEAASKLIEAHGLEALKMSDIAETANIPIGSLYQYFPNRSAVIARLAAMYFERFSSIVERRLSDAQTREDLAAAFRKTIWDVYQITKTEAVFRDIWLGTQADRTIRHIDLEDSIANARTLAEAMRRVGDQTEAGLLEDRCLLAIHLTGAAARMALDFPPRRGDRLVRSWLDAIIDILQLEAPVKTRGKRA